MNQTASHRIAALGILALIVSGCATTPKPPLYLDSSQTTEARINDLLPRMTLEEKVSLIHARSKFSVAGVPRLGIPVRWLSDGPHGVREDIPGDDWNAANHTDDFSTYMPVLLDLAATWNTDLANSYGKVIGEEARKRGKDIMLGPSLNIQRTPLNGRNFEYMGEDPYLTGQMAVGYVRGAQAQGIASCAKHFAANNQENQRGTIDVEMDERALREIYLPAFQAAVEQGGVLTVMGSYNLFRGQHCCENDYLLNKILKNEWGFKGLVVSDWGGVHSTAGAAMNGMDLEMGTDRPADKFYLAKPFLDGLKNGQYPMSILDDKVRRNLYVMFMTHSFEPQQKPSAGSLNTTEHQAIARRIAEEGIVLLKNDRDLLPLNLAKVPSIAVIGENAMTPLGDGGGSAGIKAFYEITPLQGIVKRAGSAANISFSMGYAAPPPPVRGRGPRATSRPTSAPADPGADEALIARAVQAAKSADVAIVFAGLNHSRFHDTEGSDRLDMKLPYGQNELIQRVADANPHTIVVLIDGGAMEMDPWINRVPAIVQAWYPGMEGGNAIARILFGDVNPSGKLPCTFPRRLLDSPAHALGAYPGKNGVEYYQEGLLVGYRWFDTKNIEPLFPFGYGLSFTKFAYSDLTLSNENGRVAVRCQIANRGDRDGAEVVQVYVHQMEPNLPRPEKELKGFLKTFLKSGEHKMVSITLDRHAFAYYDPQQKGWVSQKGAFHVLVGSSSRDIRLQQEFDLAETTVDQ